MFYNGATDQLAAQFPFNITSLSVGNPAPGVRSWIITSGPVPNVAFEPLCSGALVVATVPKFGPVNPAASRFAANLNLLTAVPVPGRPDCITTTSEVTFFDTTTGALVDPAVVATAMGSPFGFPFSSIHVGVFMGGTGATIVAT